MANNYVAPIDHSVGSAAATTAGGAASGALSGAARAFWKGIKTLAIVGGIVGIGYALLSTGLVTIPAALAGAEGGVVLPAIVGKLTSVIGWALAGTAIGGAVGVAAGYITIPAGGIIGGAKGASRAANQVKEERGQAAMVQAQVDMVRAQSMAPVVAQGSAMNMANPRISAADMQYDGRVNGQELAYSR